MKYSVIMPVYGVERYLDESVQSVLAQTFPDFELILVDDCSPDLCPQKCDGYANRDPRVRVIHKPENEGLGKARNTGLDAAAGRYVLFMDSDDRITENALEELDAAMDTDTDVLVFGVRREYENAAGEITRTEELSAEAFRAIGKEGCAEAFLRLNDAHIFPFAWNKIYSRAFLRAAGLQFETTPLIEDFLFNVAVFSATDAVKIVPGVYYRYRKPAHETLVSRYHPEFFALCKRKYQLERAFLSSHGALTPETQETVADAHIRHVVSVIVRNRSKRAKLSFTEQLRRIREMLSDPDTRLALQQGGRAGAVMRITAFLMRHKLTLACCLLGFAAEKLLPGGKRF